MRYRAVNWLGVAFLVVVVWFVYAVVESARELSTWPF